MNRFRTAWIAIASALVALAVGLWLGGHPANLPREFRDLFVDKNTAVRAQLIKDVQSDFYKNVSSNDLEQAGLRGIVASLHDRFSQYLSPSEAKAFEQDVEGQFEGIGMTVDSRNTKQGLKVAMVFPGSPAKDAGIKPGDRIVAVNGKSIMGENADVATAKIRGKAGTRVTLTVKADSKQRTITLTRRKLDLPVVTGKVARVKGQKVGVVRFATFSQGSSGQLRKEIDNELKAGARGLVFDLRGNGGGILTEGVNVASIFLPKNELVVSTNGRTQPPQKLYSTGNQIKDVPVVVLVDGNTASASEIVAGALRDHNRAEIVGTKTFGKGVFQELKPLSNNGLLRLTVGQFFLPKGENLGGDGIDPQVKAQDNPKTTPDEALAIGERELLKKLQ